MLQRHLVGAEYNWPARWQTVDVLGEHRIDLLLRQRRLAVAPLAPLLHVGGHRHDELAQVTARRDERPLRDAVVQAHEGRFFDRGHGNHLLLRLAQLAAPEDRCDVGEGEAARPMTVLANCDPGHLALPDRVLRLIVASALASRAASSEWHLPPGQPVGQPAAWLNHVPCDAIALHDPRLGWAPSLAVVDDLLRCIHGARRWLGHVTGGGAIAAGGPGVTHMEVERLRLIQRPTSRRRCVHTAGAAGVDAAAVLRRRGIEGGRLGSTRQPKRAGPAWKQRRAPRCRAHSADAAAEGGLLTTASPRQRRCICLGERKVNRRGRRCIGCGSIADISADDTATIDGDGL
mmetsp:Transcript_72789/g.204412  ORF Transcript_72789/g.204412 Transcript_72789/m.204412 type:complete len:346 (-) Transcript_72789:207-1244(-)